MVSKRSEAVIQNKRKVSAAKTYAKKNKRGIVVTKSIAKIIKHANSGRLTKKRALKVMKEGEFEKIITEWNASVKELPPKIVELPKTKNGNIVDKIDKKDITFVVGGWHSHTFCNLKDTLSFIRKCFPESKIILSTWDDFDEKMQKKYIGLYDELVLSSQNELPWRNIGYNFVGQSYDRENSFNHQQLLNSRGLEMVKTKYAVKTRTDLFIQSDVFVKKYIDCVNDVPLVDENFRIFKQRVLCDNTYLHNPLKTKHPFFLSDIFLFGLTEDVRKYFSYYMMPKDVAIYWDKNDETNFKRLCKDYFSIQGRYLVEQYLLANMMLNGGIKCRFPYNTMDTSQCLRDNSVRFLANNIIVSSFETLGIFSKFYFQGGVQRPNVTISVLNEYIAKTFNIPVPKHLAYYAREDEYERLRWQLNKKVEKWKANSIIVYPLCKVVIKKVVIKTYESIGYLIQIFKRYPVLLLANWERHKMKHLIKKEGRKA